MRFRHWLLLLITGILFQSSTLAQERCGFQYLQNRNQERQPAIEQDFESWMTKKIKQRQNLRTLSTFTIPIVVHIIHNGEPVGTGFNLAVEQIQSQIDVLNEDYQRLNEDQVNTPAEFTGVAAGVDIEFVLARQDPDGLPTSGIVRVQGSKSGWTVENLDEIKAQSYWPADDYLNLWVVNLTDDYLGFAQFPITSLPGVTGPFDPLTDGVVVDAEAFGTEDAGAFDLDPVYAKGRTATHEIGHYLGLLHTFGGEGSCNTTDYVDDTPSQSEATRFCPVHPSPQCGHNTMFQNYMDYTYDECMNMFTAGQISRLVTVLQNSPRRATLSTSHGLELPTSLALDLEARRVISPLETTCGQEIVPRVELRNRGTTTITGAQIELLVNGASVETITIPLSLNQLDMITVLFSPINLPEPGTSNVGFQILQVNGGSDEEPANNSTTVVSQVVSRTTIPFTEPFNVTPSTWQVLNTDHGVTWINAQAPKGTANNRAMRMELYNYENTGSKDQLVSNAISIPGVGANILKFDRAYARLGLNNTDILRVLVSSGCSADLTQAVEIFNKSGTALETAAPTSSYFTPSSEAQWLTEEISLAAYNGENVQVIFETTNGFGNNIYIDNVSISGGDFDDVAIKSILSPTGPVFCKSNLAPVIEVQNLGSGVVGQLNVETIVNGVTTGTQLFQNLDLGIGSTAEFTLATVSLTSEGLHTIQFSLSNPDVSEEESPDNNILNTTWVLDTETLSTPLRINMDNGVPIALTSPNATMTWENVTTNYSTSLVYRAFENPNAGERAWAVTPTMNMSGTSEGSLFFDTSYGKRDGGEERLRLMVSEDCGLHYTATIFDAGGSALSNESSNTPWVPASEGDWTNHYLSINDFAGKDQVRFAFVVDNGKGNNLYLDNLEWFVEDDPTPPSTPELFSVYSSESNPYDFLLTFNLEEKEDARLVVYNAMGQVLIDSLLPGTLNQTYTVNLFGQSTGIYLARLYTANAVATAKLFVGN